MKHWVEHAEQVLFFDWVRWRAPRDDRYEQVYAIANGQLRHTTVGARLRAEGVKKGVLDIAVDVPAGKYHGAKIEMKEPGRSLSPEQKKVAEDSRSFGYAVYVARSGDEAILWLMSYFDEAPDDIKKEADKLGFDGKFPKAHEE